MNLIFFKCCPPSTSTKWQLPYIAMFLFQASLFDGCDTVPQQMLGLLGVRPISASGSLYPKYVEMYKDYHANHTDKSHCFMV